VRRRRLDERKPTVRFGVFEVDRSSGELRKQGIKLKLQEQPFQVLLALIERPGGVVTRDELQRRLWPDGVVVDYERGLNKAVNRLREVLGDDVDNPQFVETVPQRGYRFLMPLTLPEQTATPPVPNRRNILAMAGGALAAPFAWLGYRTVGWKRRPIESLAVLPLENLSGNAEQEYFSDGMTDELIGEIARLGSLRVISRTSVMQYKRGPRKSLPDIARELKVDAILEGTVVQSDGKVRISAQLIRAEDDRHIWSAKYERDLKDVMALQSDVARAVASEIHIQVTAEQQSNPARTRPVNPDAYDAFLKGNFLLYRGIPAVPKSMEFFRQAIDRDPAHAESHAGLAQVLCYAGIFGLRPSAEMFAAARVSALKALELDARNASAHNVLADVKKGLDWDLAGAIPEYRRALELNPSHLLTHLWYAECLARMGRYQESLLQSDRALALDPVSPLSINNRAMLLFRARRYADAIRTSQQALDLDPNLPNAIWWQGVSYAGLAEYSKAIAALSKAVAISPGSLFRALLGHVQGLAGERTEASRALEMLAAMAGERYVSPVDFAIVYAGLGDATAAFEWMEKAYQARACQVHEIGWFYFDRFRSDPGHSDLMKRVGLLT
jgi:TolB-like protein/DNA-binding winged helix-turn-helix (wHTH) protein/Flp pilus assembly protein TadD